MSIGVVLCPTRRRTQPARSLNSLLGCLLDAARGPVRGLGRAGVAGGFSLQEAGSVRWHGASLFFLAVAGIANRDEFFVSVRKGVEHELWWR